MEREQYSIHAKLHVFAIKITSEPYKETSTVLGTCVHQKTIPAFPHPQAGAPDQLQEVQLCNWAPARQSERAVRNFAPCHSQAAQKLRLLMRYPALCDLPHKQKGTGD